MLNYIIFIYTIQATGSAIIDFRFEFKGFTICPFHAGYFTIFKILCTLINIFIVNVCVREFFSPAA